MLLVGGFGDEQARIGPGRIHPMMAQAVGCIGITVTPLAGCRGSRSRFGDAAGALGGADTP